VLAVTLNVPAARRQNIMTLLQFLPIPLHMPALDNRSLYLQPKHELLAVATTDAGSPKYFRTLSALDAADCTRRAELLVCANARPARSVADYAALPPNEQCLIALFLSHQDAIVKHCPFSFADAFDDILPVDDSAALTVSATTDTASIACADGHFLRVLLPPGRARVEVRSDCSLHTRAGIFHAVDHPRDTRAILVRGSDWLNFIDSAIQAAPEFSPAAQPSHAPLHVADFQRLHEARRTRSSLSFLTLVLYCVCGGLAAGFGVCSLTLALRLLPGAPCCRRRSAEPRVRRVRRSRMSSSSASLPPPPPTEMEALLANPLFEHISPARLRQLLLDAAATRPVSPQADAPATNTASPTYANAL
jgi:hypothetical protein